MIRNRLREWRQRRGLAIEALAERVGTSRTTLHRLETQPDAAIHELIAPLARELGVRFGDLFTDEPSDGVEIPLPGQSAIPFQPAPGHVLEGASVRPRHAMYQLLTDDLSEIGLYRGDVVIVEQIPDLLSVLQNADAVVATLQDETGETIHVHRQYVAPQLLVVNSERPASHNLHLTRDGVTLVGLVRQRIGDLRIAPRAEIL